MSSQARVHIELGQRLRQARELAGLSQGQVARQLGFHRPTISEIQAGRRRVSAEELSRLADLYDVSLSWLTKNVAEAVDSSVELAARELAKLKKDDLNRVLDL